MILTNIEVFFRTQRANLKELISDSKVWFSDKRHKKLFIACAVNSLTVFILAYLISYVTHQVITMFVADSYQIPSIIRNYKIDFLLSPYSQLWNGTRVINVTSAGPVVSLILGTLFYSLFIRIKNQRGILKLLVLWLFIHEMNLFFGGFVAGLVSSKGFGLVFMWLYMNKMVKIILALIFIFFMVMIGYFSFIKFLSTAPTVNLIKKNNRRYFIIAQAIIPWILGTFLQLILTFPHTRLYEFTTYLTLIFFLTPVLFNTSEGRRPKVSEERSPTSFNYTYIIISVAAVIFFRVVFGIGIKLTPSF